VKAQAEVRVKAEVEGGSRGKRRKGEKEKTMAELS
jgi:hypothetical protein